MPVNVPGYAGTFGFHRWPLQTITPAYSRTAPSEVDTRQPSPARRPERLEPFDAHPEGHAPAHAGLVREPLEVLEHLARLGKTG